MNMLILDEIKRAELDALNASGEPARQLFARPMLEGLAALNTDLLSDCAPGQTWAHYGEFLASLWTSDVSDSEFADPQLS